MIARLAPTSQTLQPQHSRQRSHLDEHLVVRGALLPHARLERSELLLLGDLGALHGLVVLPQVPHQLRQLVPLLLEHLPRLHELRHTAPTPLTAVDDAHKALVVATQPLVLMLQGLQVTLQEAAVTSAIPANADARSYGAAVIRHGRGRPAPAPPPMSPCIQPVFKPPTFMHVLSSASGDTILCNSLQARKTPRTRLGYSGACGAAAEVHLKARDPTRLGAAAAPPGVRLPPAERRSGGDAPHAADRFPQNGSHAPPPLHKLHPRRKRGCLYRPLPPARTPRLCSAITLQAVFSLPQTTDEQRQRQAGTTAKDGRSGCG